MRIRLGKQAAEQIQQADRWWREHRVNAELLRQEVGRALALMRDVPHIGQTDSMWPHVRRFYLRKIGYFVYYRIGDEFIDVLAFWHEARGTSPLGSG